MKNLEQLQNEACAKVKENIVEMEQSYFDDEFRQDYKDKLLNTVKQEIKNAITEAFKETSVERKDERPLDPFTNEPVETYGYEETYNSALSDTKIKQNEFINN
tara:strand:+ start:534 stop:842 length:309 start_codon:yes stop_codon:yes gene_type:complete